MLKIMFALLRDDLYSQYPSTRLSVDPIFIVLARMARMARALLMNRNSIPARGRRRSQRVRRDDLHAQVNTRWHLQSTRASHGWPFQDYLLIVMAVLTILLSVPKSRHYHQASA